MFKTIDGYGQILTGAHRKPAPIIRPPVLIWHLGFWAESKASIGAAGGRQSRKEIVDHYLQAVYAKLVPSVPEHFPGVPGVSDFQVLNATPDYAPLFQNSLDENGDLKPLDPDRISSGKDSQMVTFRFFWWGLLVQLRFEFHTEYLTLSAYVDLSTQRNTPSGQDAVPAAVQNLCLELEKLEANIKADAAVHADAKKHDSSIRRKYESISEALYFNLWELMYESILSPSQQSVESLGRVFADFRGLVLSKPVPSEYFGQPTQVETSNFQQPFWRQKGGPAPQDQHKPPRQHKDYWQQQRVAFWPLMTGRVRSVDFSKYEFTASQMLNGRALYVTALGPQPPTRASGRFPLCYFLYTHTLNGWQIGRLVDRINYLGTVRLAALIQLEELRGAALKLSDCEKKIKAAFEQVHQVRPSSGGQLPQKEPTSDEEREKVDSEIKNLRIHLEEAEKIVGEINRMFDGDIEYRIERSRYYVRQFFRGLGALRIKRLEGFQPYNVFVERRLGAAFDSIDLLGIRYQRVRADIAALFQSYLAHETRAVEIATRDQNREIKRIQSVADFALFAALLPYYTGNLLQHVFWPHTEHMPQQIWVVVIVFFVSILAFRMRDEVKMASATIWRKYSQFITS